MNPNLNQNQGRETSPLSRLSKTCYNSFLTQPPVLPNLFTSLIKPIKTNSGNSVSTTLS